MTHSNNARTCAHPYLPSKALRERKMRTRSPQLQPRRRATVLKLIVCAAAVCGTAPQPADGCNGALIDPEGCGDDDFICTNTIFGPDSRAKCPILCNSCVTTTATTTAVARVCNGKPDPDDCGADASVFSDAEFKLAQSAATAEFLAADTGGGWIPLCYRDIRY